MLIPPILIFEASQRRWPKYTHCMLHKPPSWIMTGQHNFSFLLIVQIYLNPWLASCTRHMYPQAKAANLWGTRRRDCSVAAAWRGGRQRRHRLRQDDAGEEEVPWELCWTTMIAQTRRKKGSMLHTRNATQAEISCNLLMSWDNINKEGYNINKEGCLNWIGAC